MSSGSFYFQNPSTSDRRKSQFHYDSEEDPENRPKYEGLRSLQCRTFIAGILLVCLVAVLSTIMTKSSVTNKSSHKLTPSISFNAFESHLNGVDIRVVSPGYGELKSVSQLSWRYIVEPARTQILHLANLDFGGEKVEVDEDLMHIEWNINGDLFHGSKVEFQLSADAVGSLLPFSVKVSPKSGKEVKKGIDRLYSFTVKDTLTVKYVRREFRSLTNADKINFIDSLQKVYKLSDEEGQRLYGAKFHNAAYFLLKHLTGAGRTDCDHWHDGAGLLPHHAAFTLEMEQSLQSVNPSVTIPYWEYGMDAYLYSNLADSPMFAKDFLGEMNPSNDEHRIDDGSFWSNVKIPRADRLSSWSLKDTGSLNPYKNAYGAMRSPWNNNPSSYIGRHNTTYDISRYATVPECSILQPCYQSDSLSLMNYCLNGNTHGPVHIMIGGAWGDEKEISDGEYSYLLGANRILFFKILWRMGYTRCPEVCEVSSFDSCRCSVPDQYIEKYGAKKILTDSNIVSVISARLSSATDDDYLNILRIVEHPGAAGEMFTSAAPFDPTFWPLHGSMERMVGLKRLNVDSGKESFDESWGYTEYDPTDGAAYLPGVCDWSRVSSVTDLTLPTCDLEAECEGHGADDILEFSNFLNRGETYTNMDFYKFLHPNNLELPYVYDTYDFDYCSSYGYDFFDKSQSKGSKALREGAKKDIPSAM